MSLLMQALRKAERAKHGEVLTEPQDERGLQLEPVQTDVQKAAAGSEAALAGGTSFTLEPLEPPASAAADAGEDEDEEIPVIPAEEVMHDPVPPQARPGLQRGGTAWLRPVDVPGAAEIPAAADTRAALQARAAADARRATDMRDAVEARATAETRRAANMPHGPGASAGGLSVEPPSHAAAPGPHMPTDTGSADDTFFAERRTRRAAVPSSTTRAPGSASEHLGRPRASAGHMPGEGAAQSSRSGTATRAGASAARNRAIALAGVLGLIVLGFAYLYWRGINSPGPGAALPPVPMPAPGAIAAAPVAAPGATPGAAIPGIDASQPQGAPAAAAPVTAPATATAPATTGATTATMAGATTQDITATVPAAAAAATPNTADGARHVIMPTDEQLASIQDPTIRAEAMRMATEQATRIARNAEVAQHASAQHAHEAAGITSTSVPVAASTAGAVSANGPGARGSTSGSIRSSRSPRPSQPASASSIAAAAPAAGPGASVVNINGGAPAPSGAGDVHIVRNNATQQVSPTLQNAWSAYQAGDLAAAHQQYQAALQQDPNNRDALLGAAAVASKERNGQQAAAHYLHLLELDPHDPEALAGLVAQRPGDLPQAETKLKGILRTAPESGPVLFTLGNLYAKQGRWSEAQQAYFRAYGAAPANADYAFNLAVGLDRLNQSRLAQDYYQRALTLAQSAPAGFDQNAVRKRLAELAAPAP